MWVLIGEEYVIRNYGRESVFDSEKDVRMGRGE